MHVFNESNVFILFHFLWGCYGGALDFLGGAGAPASPSLAPPMSASEVDTSLVVSERICAVNAASDAECSVRCRKRRQILLLISSESTEIKRFTA